MQLRLPLLPDRYLLYARIVLVIFSTVGIAGMLAFPDWFPRLTPLNLLLNMILLIAFIPEGSANMLRWYILVAVIGFSIELLGVRTGVIFGVYQYGGSLGPKIAEVPLMIAVNWWITTVCSYHLADKLSKNIYLGSIIGALIMTGLDALIEPMAPRLDFWAFAGGIAPIRNYIGWFGVGFMLQFLGRTLQVPSFNPLAPTVFLLQIALFIVLNLVNFFT